jgi:hypothetical protein
VIHRHIQAGRQKNKGKTTQNTLNDQVQHFIKKKIFIGSTEFPDRISAKDRKVYYTSSKERKLQEKVKIYATSAVGSMAEEGVEDSAAAAPGGGVAELGAGVKEAAKGVIRDTMPGAYSFAFLKNPSISERGRAREELIFS